MFSQSFGCQELTATSTTHIYENSEVRAELTEKTLGEVSNATLSFFASRVTFDPDLTNLPGGVGRDQIIDQVEENAREVLVDQMEANGVERIEQTGTGTLTVESGDDASRTDFMGTLAFDPVSIPVADGETVSVETDGIPIAGQLAVWHADESVLIGAVPSPSKTSLLKSKRRSQRPLLSRSMWISN